MIKVTLKDGSVKEYAKGTTVMEIAKAISEGLARSIVAASVNGEVVGLDFEVNDDCELNLSNFKDVFSYFNDLEFKILEIVPYKNDNIKYLYYSDNMDYIISNFKSKYLDSVIDKSSYITNICIKNVKINTANKYISEFRNKKK